MQSLVPRGELENGPQDPELKSLLEKYQTLQTDYRQLSTDRSGLSAKVNENVLVKEEMESLDDEARVFKLVGPVLVRQEVDEARANVQSRMDLLKRQVDSVEEKVKAKEAEMEELKTKVVKRQKELQGEAKAEGKGEAAGAASE